MCKEDFSTLSLSGIKYDGENLESRGKKRRYIWLQSLFKEEIFLQSFMMRRSHLLRYFNKKFFLIARNPEMIVRCLSSSALSCNMTR